MAATPKIIASASGHRQRKKRVPKRQCSIHGVTLGHTPTMVSALQAALDNVLSTDKPTPWIPEALPLPGVANMLRGYLQAITLDMRSDTVPIREYTPESKTLAVLRLSAGWAMQTLFADFRNLEDIDGKTWQIQPCSERIKHHPFLNLYLFCQQNFPKGWQDGPHANLLSTVDLALEQFLFLLVQYLERDLQTALDYQVNLLASLVNDESDAPVIPEPRWLESTHFDALFSDMARYARISADSDTANHVASDSRAQRILRACMLHVIQKNPPLIIVPKPPQKDWQGKTRDFFKGTDSPEWEGKNNPPKAMPLVDFCLGFFPEGVQGPCRPVGDFGTVIRQFLEHLTILRTISMAEASERVIRQRVLEKTLAERTAFIDQLATCLRQIQQTETRKTELSRAEKHWETWLKTFDTLIHGILPEADRDALKSISQAIRTRLGIGWLEKGRKILVDDILTDQHIRELTTTHFSTGASALRTLRTENLYDWQRLIAPLQAHIITINEELISSNARYELEEQFKDSASELNAWKTGMQLDALDTSINRFTGVNNAVQCPLADMGTTPYTLKDAYDHRNALKACIPPSTKAGPAASTSESSTSPDYAALLAALEETKARFQNIRNTMPDTNTLLTALDQLYERLTRNIEEGKSTFRQSIRDVMRLAGSEESRILEVLAEVPSPPSSSSAPAVPTIGTLHGRVNTYRDAVNIRLFDAWPGIRTHIRDNLAPVITGFQTLLTPLQTVPTTSLANPYTQRCETLLNTTQAEVRALTNHLATLSTLPVADWTDWNSTWSKSREAVRQHLPTLQILVGLRQNWETVEASRADLDNALRGISKDAMALCSPDNFFAHGQAIVQIREAAENTLSGLQTQLDTLQTTNLQAWIPQTAILTAEAEQRLQACLDILRCLQILESRLRSPCQRAVTTILDRLTKALEDPAIHADQRSLLRPVLQDFHAIQDDFLNHDLGRMTQNAPHQLRHLSAEDLYQRRLLACTEHHLHDRQMERYSAPVQDWFQQWVRRWIYYPLQRIGNLFRGQRFFATWGATNFERHLVETGNEAWQAFTHLRPGDGSPERVIWSAQKTSLTIAIGDEEAESGDENDDHSPASSWHGVRSG